MKPDRSTHDDLHTTLVFDHTRTCGLRSADGVFGALLDVTGHVIGAGRHGHIAVGADQLVRGEVVPQHAPIGPQAHGWAAADQAERDGRVRPARRPLSRDVGDERRRAGVTGQLRDQVERGAAPLAPERGRAIGS